MRENKGEEQQIFEEQQQEHVNLIEEASEYIKKKYKFVIVEESKDILYYKDGVYIRGGEILIEKEVESLYDYEISNKLLAEIRGHIMRSTYRSRNGFDSNLS
jgi:hypothetical protein